MLTTYGSRLQYLRLAQFSHRLIDLLYRYLDRESTEGLKENLQRAVGALDALKRGDLYRFGHHRAAAFSSYEQVHTANVWSEGDLDEAIALMKRIIDEPAERRMGKRHIERLIGLLGQLRARALWNFEQNARPEGGPVARLAVAR
jgi:hypothetical protein